MIIDLRALAMQDFPATIAVWVPSADRAGPASWRLVAYGPALLEIPGGLGPHCRVQMTFQDEQALHREVSDAAS